MVSPYARAYTRNYEGSIFNEDNILKIMKEIFTYMPSMRNIGLSFSLLWSPDRIVSANLFHIARVLY